MVSVKVDAGQVRDQEGLRHVLVVEHKLQPDLS
jgi:hypothetical protein